jgi:Protein of unknown function (DUF3455)
MTSRTRTIFGLIVAIVAAGVLAGALLTTSGSPASAVSGAHPILRISSVQRAAPAHLNRRAADAVPPGLRPPTGNTLSAKFVGAGVQVYQCSTAGAWVFLEPAANLVSRARGASGIQRAIHYKGPTWESTTDGSLVQGTTIASSPVAGSIPQLLLRATANRGTGIFGPVTYINRLNTRGGAAPTSSCTSGQTIGVPYTAQYLFYVPSGS